MKLTVLIDNNTYIDQYYYGEPGVCYYIEEGDTKLLLDLGYSDAFIKNAELMGIDLSQVQKIVLSHGHDDHAGGLLYFTKRFDMSKMEIVAHPSALTKKVYESGQSIGTPIERDVLEGMCKVTLSKMPVKISENLTFLGEIPGLNAFEKRMAFGKTLRDGCWTEDVVYDDTALVYRGKEGLYIITGCAHSGICNIIEYAKSVCKEDRVVGLIGGFHLFRVNERVESTIEYFKANRVKQMYPCHCVSFAVKAELFKHFPVKEVGVGLEILWE